MDTFRVGRWRTDEISSGWEHLGVRGAANEYKGGLCAVGVGREERWRQTFEKYPVADEILGKLRQARQKKSKGETASRLRARKAARRSDNFEARTGVPVLDWIYANLDREGELLGRAPGAGDYALLLYHRKHKDVFYKNVYMPALMRATSGVKGPRRSEPEEEAIAGSAEVSETELLLKIKG